MMHRLEQSACKLAPTSPGLAQAYSTIITELAQASACAVERYPTV